MATWGQIVNRQALNVIVGEDLAATLAEHFVEGYDGGYPGVPWSLIPDGTVSGATTYDGTTFTNPAPPAAPAPSPGPTKDEILAQLSALAAAVQALP